MRLDGVSKLPVAKAYGNLADSAFASEFRDSDLKLSTKKRANNDLTKKVNKAIGKFWQAILLVFFGIFISLGTTIGVWAIAYRIPAAAPKIIDLRKSKAELASSVTLCASLADNPIGFPGHAYVIWSPSTKVDPENDLSIGYMPSKFADQFTSLYKDVDGALLKNIRGNTRNLDRLTIRLSRQDYERSLRFADEFKVSNFKTGERDCVAFVNFLAGKLGLKTYDRGFIFPQDYIRIMKEQN